MPESSKIIFFVGLFNETSLCKVTQFPFHYQMNNNDLLSR